MEITFGKPVEQVVQDAMQTYASGNGPNGEPTPAQDYWVKKSDHLAALAAQQEEIDRLKAELAMVDEALARRPAVADSPNRYTSICAAFNMASRTEKAESMEKHWKFHFDRLEAENAKLQARLDAMSAPVSDEELKEARATIEQLKSYQANYEHATEIERAEKDADTQKLESLLSNSNAERRELRLTIDTLRAMLAARAKTEATG